MRVFIVALFTCMMLAWQPANATSVVIGANQSLAALPLNPGTGLLGSYYKASSTSNIGSLANANLLISSSGGPTATFTTTTVCFPDCANSNIDDNNNLQTLLGSGHYSNFSYTSPSNPPTSVDHSVITLNGYIAITQVGTYNFTIGSDDGSQLTIGGQQVINNDNDHGYTIAGGQATFSAIGLYAISLTYFEDSGSTGFEFFGSNPSGVCFVGRAANCGTGSGTASTALYATLPATATPEPASILLFTAGLGGLAWARRRRAI